jgi:hypothetical protein
LRLTDTQLILLANGAKHNDGIITVPDRLKGAAASRAITPLIKQRLAEEIAAMPKAPIWRRDPNGNAKVLRITEAGLAAISAKDEHAAASETAAPAPVGKFPTKDAQSRNVASAKLNRTVSAGSPGDRGTKQDQVLAMLGAEGGATIAALMKATGWQRHSVRGFLSATVRKARGLTLVAEGSGDARRYRIASPARTPSTAKKQGQR